jgi:hypothetical protein
MAEVHVHLYGDDYLVEWDGNDWRASVPCFCGARAPAHPTDWHWHDVARTDTFNGLLALLDVRQIIKAAA